MEFAPVEMAKDEGGTPPLRLDGVYVALLLVAFGARLAAVWLLPPLLDVYYYDTQAVQALIHGLNPYDLLYTGIPSWLATAGAASVFAYLPTVPLFLFPFGAAWDIRLGLVFADLVVALSIASLGGPTARRASLVFALLPFDVLFSTSYPNNTLVGMCFLGLAALGEVRGKRGLSAVSLGLSLAASQFVWLLYPLFARHYVSAGWKRGAIISLAAAVAVVAPFLLWSPGTFLFDTIIFQFARPVQQVVTPMAFGYNVNPTLNGIAVTLAGVAVPLYVRAPIFLAALALAVKRSAARDSLFINATWLMLFSVWLLPSDFSWWYLELPLQTFLIWLVLRRKAAALPATS